MALFRKGLMDDIRRIDKSMKKTISGIQDNIELPCKWSWFEKRKKKLKEIEELDLLLIQELSKLHKKGLDYPVVSLKIYSTARQIKEIIELMIAEQKLSPIKQKAEKQRLKKLMDEINLLIEQEEKYIENSRKKNLYEGRGKALPQVVINYFVNLANKAEKSGDDFNKFIIVSKSTFHKNELFGFGGGTVTLIKKFKKKDPFEIKKMKKELDKKIKLKVFKQFKEFINLSKKILYVKQIQDSSWIHYKINGGLIKKDLHYKSYISIDPITFSAKAMIEALKALAISGFVGNLKIYNQYMSFLTIDYNDNIVIHSKDKHYVIRAAHVVTNVLEKSGVKVGEPIRRSKFNIGYDFIVPTRQEHNLKEFKASFTQHVAHIVFYYLENIIKQKKITNYSSFRKNVRKYFKEKGLFLKWIYENENLKPYYS